MAETTNEVVRFFGQYPPDVRDLALELRDLVLAVIPDARETLDLSSRIVGYGFGPGYSDLICTIIPSKTGVKLGIVRGSELPDPNALLQGAGKRHRSVAFVKRSDLKRPGLKPLLRVAVTSWKRRSKPGG